MTSSFTRCVFAATTTRSCLPFSTTSAPSSDRLSLSPRKGGRDQTASLVAAEVIDYPVASYAATTSGSGNDFEVVGDELEPGPYGIGVRKEDTELRDVKVLALATVLALTLAISGCGGGDADSDSDNPVLIPPTTVIP